MLSDFAKGTINEVLQPSSSGKDMDSENSHEVKAGECKVESLGGNQVDEQCGTGPAAHKAAPILFQAPEQVVRSTESKLAGTGADETEECTSDAAEASSLSATGGSDLEANSCCCKRAFVPPEDLLKSRRGACWKGSAATSAFRPAEPRKALEFPLGTANISLPDAMVSKPGRPLADEASDIGNHLTSIGRRLDAHYILPNHLGGFLNGKRRAAFPIVATGGPQRILASSTGSNPFNPDVYREQCCSSSPAVVQLVCDSSSGGRLCISTVPSQVVAQVGVGLIHYPRPYAVNLPDSNNNGAVESSRKWARQGLDLNAGSRRPVEFFLKKEQQGGWMVISNPRGRRDEYDTKQ
uniref:Uncharacterized protein n=1 Tax=Populus alba TaxID=43335 RepID=A0A4U5QXM1_POPAL|nr:hypothetical protein D5086_0000026050 [Populus alba]